MDALHNQVFTPTTLAELYASWARFPDAVLYAGGTEIARTQAGRTLHLPRNIISLSRIDELRRISRTERYLEIGAAVTLDEILSLGKIVPEALRRALQDAANPQVRNLATIGGNLCCAKRRMDAFAPLAALDARLELRTAMASRWVAAARFAPAFGPPLLAEQEILTRLRVPLEAWDYIVHRKLGQARWPDDEGGVFTFIARAQKGILSEVRLVFAGVTLIRDREIDTDFVGKSLPLARRDAVAFVERWRNRLKESDYPKGLLKNQVLNLAEFAAFGLTD
jgi:CO/xanthine dehydrogenase FAD-binding subunit